MSARRTWVVTLVVILAATTLVCAGAARAAVSRGVCPLFALDLPAEERDALFDELSNDLRAAWVRLEVQWYRGEPAQGAYDEEYLQGVVDGVTAASARGLKVMLTVYGTPRWASDSRFWTRPPAGLDPGYHHRYAPRLDALPAFQSFAQTLATRCGAAVQAFECWNEPNLWMYLCPQKYGSDTRFGARRYRDILKAFWTGVKASGSPAIVVGGAIGPYGTDDWTRTSPNLFARQLRDLGAGAYMDALSHHPYQIGSSHTFAPERLPRFPTRSIALSNLSALATLFPGKPLYLTEYGYNTQDCPGIGGLGVGNTRQADYLRRAYAYAGRYRQVKALFWYLLQDHGGWTTGLRSAGGSRKPSWYTFSRVTRLTLSAGAASVRRGGSVTLRGELTWYSRGQAAVGLGSRVLSVQALTGGAWKQVATVRTTSAGAFSLRLRPSRTVTYRVVWAGVANSSVRRVRVY